MTEFWWVLVGSAVEVVSPMNTPMGSSIGCIYLTRRKAVEFKVTEPQKMKKGQSRVP